MLKVDIIKSVFGFKVIEAMVFLVTFGVVVFFQDGIESIPVSVKFSLSIIIYYFLFMLYLPLVIIAVFLAKPSEGRSLARVEMFFFLGHSLVALGLNISSYTKLKEMLAEVNPILIGYFVVLLLHLTRTFFLNKKSALAI